MRRRRRSERAGAKSRKRVFLEAQVQASGRLAYAKTTALYSFLYSTLPPFPPSSRSLLRNLLSRRIDVESALYGDLLHIISVSSCLREVVDENGSRESRREP